jgi:hypothetical protein
MFIRLDDDVQGSGSDAILRVKAWLSAAIALPPGAVVLVTELRCREEGCPPLETVLAVLVEGHRWHRTLHRAAADLTEAEIRQMVASDPPTF